MKVLFLPKWYPNKYDSQLGIFIQKHAKAVALYCKVAVLYALPDSDLNDDFQIVESRENGFLEVIVYYKKEYTQSILKRALWGKRYFQANQKGLSIIFEQFGQPDISHVNVLTRPCLLAYYLKINKKIPYCITEHWSGYITDKFRKKNKFSQYLTRQLVQKSAAITVVSEKLKAAMLANDFKRVDYIVPNVVEAKDLEQPINKKVREEAKIIILTVADLDDNIKNVSAVIRAIANLKTRLPSIVYHIIGGGKDEMALRDLAKTLEVMDKWVFFHGRQSNDYVLDFMQSIDFLIINSNFETFSVVTAEALASGKPVIASCCGGPEQFITPETGLLIEPRNQKELEAAIVYMSEHYQDYEVEALQNSIRQPYSKEVIGKKFLSIYEKCLFSDV